ncbi:MAG: 1-deoxy-D-xylulose-5-phosphate reductoisomerase [Neisseriaceae bacterium]
MYQQNIAILGSTGSIGTSTLEVIRCNLSRYNVFALTANNNVEKLFEQCCIFKPQYAVIIDKVKSNYLQDKLKLNGINTVVLSEEIDLVKIVEHPDVNIVMSAIVGSKGLLSTYRAIKANKRVLLANKESLIAGGQLILNALKNSKAKLIPVDSEHSAIFQCLESNSTANIDNINRIILTASGGPFLNRSIKDIQNVTVDEALKHPNWNMGKKITIDCSTLMNKGLEVIEAYWLFGQNLDKIDVVIHPQSVIHSMVEYIDGSIIAQLGTPDMKTPIAYALSYPERIISGSKKLEFNKLLNLTFCEPDYAKFPCLKLAFEAIQSGGTMPAILNAANEVAVAAFLNKQIRFYDISDAIKKAMDAVSSVNCTTVEEVIEIDSKVRHFVGDMLGSVVS